MDKVSVYVCGVWVCACEYYVGWYVHVNICGLVCACEYMWVGMCVCGYIIFTTIIYSINLIMYPLILIIIH